MPFSFDDEFASLRTLSASLADLRRTERRRRSSASTRTPRRSRSTGSASGLNVFTVSASQLTQAAGVTITLTQPGATALINVTTDTDLTVSLQYMNLSGVRCGPRRLEPPAGHQLKISGPGAWQGLLLAPNAERDAWTPTASSTAR